jgi:cobalt-zinc-cadmium efflux system outer membrane protein
MERQLFYAIILLCSCVTYVYAESQESTHQGLSLDNALKIALRESPSYKASQSEIAAASGRSRQAGLWDNPDLFFETEEWPVDESFDEARYKLGVSQVVPFPGRKSLEKEVAENSLSETEAREQAKRIRLMREVRLAFYRVLMCSRILGIDSKLTEVARSSMNTAKARLEAGESTAQEVLRAEIQYERAKSEQAEHERNFYNAKSKLAVLLGRPGESFNAIGKLQQTAPKELLEKQNEALLETHPLIVAAEMRVKRAQSEFERTSLDPYPDLTLTLAGGRRESTDETLVDFGVSLPLPLIDSSKGNREAAKALLEKAQAQLMIARQTLSGNLKQWRQTLEQLDSQARSYKRELLPRAEKALAMVQTGFREGEYAFNDLLDTQRTTAEMRLLYEQKLFELNQAIAEVESLLNPNNHLME